MSRYAFQLSLGYPRRDGGGEEGGRGVSGRASHLQSTMKTLLTSAAKRKRSIESTGLEGDTGDGFQMVSQTWRAIQG